MSDPSKPSINQFISNIKTKGLAKSNRYAVQFTLPSVNSTIVRNALLLCDSVNLPALNYATIENRTFGEVTHTPYERQYGDIAMSFYMDKDMSVKAIFDSWMDSIQNPETRTFNYYSEYAKDITIEVQDLQNKSTYTVKLFEAYPKSIGSVPLAYEMNGVMKLTVNFVYKYYEASAAASLNPVNEIPGVDGNYTEKYGILQQLINDPLNTFNNPAIQQKVVGALGAWGITKVPSVLSKIRF
jgi:hypothetical protein